MLFTLLLLFFTPLPSYAYLDPGTGSMLLYFVIGVVATTTYFIKDMFYYLRGMFLAKQGNTDLRSLSGVDILFYSEGKNYWNLFLPVIRALEKREIACAYYTSDLEDPGIKYDSEYLTAHYIGTPLQSYTLLKNVRFKLVIMTTPQLDVLQLRRSKYVDHYCHLIHAPTDALIYKKFAFDYFDSVMCSGDHQIESIRLLEQVRNLKAKRLFKTGLTYYDEMCSVVQDSSVNNDRPTVLVAPTWGSNGMLTIWGLQPVEQLLASGFRVILRPHPQMYISQKELIGEIEDRFIGRDNFILDKNSSAAISMGIANILLSDMSGIIFDFLFLLAKPVAVLFQEVKREGLEAEDITKEIWEQRVIPEITTIIPTIEQLTPLINQSLKSCDTKKITEFRCESIYNWGKAGEVAASQIIELLKELT